MNTHDVNRLIELEAIKTEVIAMQTANECGDAAASPYDELCFVAKAEEMRELIKPEVDDGCICRSYHERTGDHLPDCPAKVKPEDTQQSFNQIPPKEVHVQRSCESCKHGSSARSCKQLRCWKFNLWAPKENQCPKT